MLELLAPAGSTEAVTAAVQNGAGAVYFGYGDFNARRGAKNFSGEEAAAAVSYCHLRGTKAYVTLNTLLTDRELPKAAEIAAHASRSGADALIVQDLGAVRMLRQVAPDLPVHGSTQMTIHSLDGVKACADLGMKRVVLGRELSLDQIAYICARSPIEIEIFGHGALCMCWSGQCFLSSVIGGRSGNRGLCAQPCRMKYALNDQPAGHPLSLKDLSLVQHLKEIEEAGVTCLKIEGRMKRPEYVAVVTKIYAKAIAEGKEPGEEELEQLRQAFSRDGFTDGYFTGDLGEDMFGVRPEGEKEPRELFAAAREEYTGGEKRREPVNMHAEILPGQPARVSVEDTQGRTGTAQGPVPEPARTVPLTREKVEELLVRTGGTPYEPRTVTVQMEEGLSLPVSAVNSMRREALEDLSIQRLLIRPARREEKFDPGETCENGPQPPVLTVSARTASQVSTELLRMKPALLYLPAPEAVSHPELLERCRREGVPVCAALPRICMDRELETLERFLSRVMQMGVEEVLAGGLGQARRASEMGFRVRGDYGLGVFNSQTLKEMRRMGFVSATASFELKLAQIRDLSKFIPVEFIAYGRLPLMLTENCIIRTQTGKHACAVSSTLRDRKGERFPVVKTWGCRNEILNSRQLFLADRAGEWKYLGLWGARLQFTTETPQECIQVMEAYRGRDRYQPRDLTRGLYFRDVE